MKHLRRRVRKVPLAYVFGAVGLVITAYWALQNYNDPLRLTAIVLLAAILWGLLSTGWTLWETISELAAQRERRPGDKVLARIAWANVRRETVRVLELLAFLWISVNVLTMAGTLVVNRVLLIVIVLLLVANGVLDRIERDQTAADLAESLSQQTAT